MDRRDRFGIHVIGLELGAKFVACKPPESQGSIIQKIYNVDPHFPINVGLNLVRWNQVLPVCISRFCLNLIQVLNGLIGLPSDQLRTGTLWYTMRLVFHNLTWHISWLLFQVLNGVIFLGFISSFEQCDCSELELRGTRCEWSIDLIENVEHAFVTLVRHEKVMPCDIAGGCTLW